VKTEIFIIFIKLVLIHVTFLLTCIETTRDLIEHLDGWSMDV